MSSIKKLAGQTLWYGGSSIAARFLNYLLTPYLTAKLSGPGYGEMSMVYAAIPFLNVVFTYGIETTFFRFTRNENPESKVYDTASISIFSSTILFTTLLLLYSGPLSNLLKLQDHPEFITYTVLIIAFDTLATLPFARLRQDGRPVKFATVQLINILITIGATYFFISVLPGLIKAKPYSPLRFIYIKDYGVGYVILANLIASFVKLLMLSKEILRIRFRFDGKLWKDMMLYALPMLIVGFGGMVNEVFDRIMLGWWAPVSSVAAAKNEVGIYSACYKLSILISLFIQAFRMGAEPFFFKQADGQNPQRTYARVMKFFVITISIMFLVVSLYLEIWKEFIRNPAFWAGLKVVPILLLANMFLGIYYNLSVWYKITNKTMSGAWITIIGALITLVINYFFIPHFSYVACAWATFFSYGFMMVASYVWGQRVYRIPYAWKKLLAYILIAVMFFFIHRGAIMLVEGKLWNLVIATLLLFIYLRFLALVEQKELARLPMVGKYFTKNLPGA